MAPQFRANRCIICDVEWPRLGSVLERQMIHQLSLRDP
jgi:hypothetical protein